MADQVSRREERMPAGRNQAINPYRAMREMMEDFFSDWPMSRIRPFEWRMQEFSPTIDIIDEEKDIRIEAEVPGMSPEDLDLTVTRDSIILKGEKKSEREEEKRGVRYSERSFGSFERVIPIPPDVESDKVEANFKNGVLSIVLPKSEQSRRQSKKVEIKSEASGESKTPHKQGRQDVQSMGAQEGMKQKGQP